MQHVQHPHGPLTADWACFHVMQRNVDANAGSFRAGPQVAKVRRLDLELATPEDPGRCREGVLLLLRTALSMCMPGRHP